MIDAAGLLRVRFDLAYDGTDFAGWARQPGRRTVEGTLADALAVVLRLAEPPALTVAGRTDAGVHALGQVAHADLPDHLLAQAADLSAPAVALTTGAADNSGLERVRRRLAGVLPGDVVVRRVTVAPAGFDARFSATGRVYRYRVTDEPADPLRRHDTLTWPRGLDAACMQAAAGRLVGEHDFAAFCRPRPGASTVRVLRRLDVARDEVVAIEAEADAFCHNQVRAMVGALLAVGEGRRPVHWPGQVLRAGVRPSDVTVAPPHGLTLMRVDYPPPDRLAERAAAARSRRRAD